MVGSDWGSMSTGGFVCQDEGSGCAAQLRLRDNAESLPRGFRLLQALRTASRTQRVLRRRSRWSILNGFEAVECCYRRTSPRGRPILDRVDDVRGLDLSHGIRTLPAECSEGCRVYSRWKGCWWYSFTTRNRRGGKSAGQCSRQPSDARTRSSACDCVFWKLLRALKGLRLKGR